MKSKLPVFVEYKMEHGQHPSSLDDLVPRYIPKIPTELVNDGEDDPYKKISYTNREGQAVFCFHTMRGPDSSAIYNIDKDTLWHDQ